MPTGYIRWDIFQSSFPTDSSLNLTSPPTRFPGLWFRSTPLAINAMESRICSKAKPHRTFADFLVRRDRNLFSSDMQQEKTWKPGNWAGSICKMYRGDIIKYLTLQREQCCTNMSCCFEHKPARNQILSPCCIPSQGDCSGFISLYFSFTTTLITHGAGSKLSSEDWGTWAHRPAVYCVWLTPMHLHTCAFQMSITLGTEWLE